MMDWRERGGETVAKATRKRWGGRRYWDLDANVTYHGAYDGVTLCGARVGELERGWVTGPHVAGRPIDCKKCLAALKREEGSR